MYQRIICIDYGDSRTGIAISDPLRITAQGLETIYHSGNEEILFNRLSSLIKEYNVEKIIVGFPINMNGTIGPRGEKTLIFIDNLKNRFNIEVLKRDERLSTVSAHKLMIETKTKKDKKKQLVDTISATYVLQTYLDSISNKML